MICISGRKQFLNRLQNRKRDSMTMLNNFWGIFMDFRDLSYVLAIARYQNITKAANSLYVTQPTLTKFLQNLEAELGQKLFRKLGHRFVLTYAGERYVEKASEILNLKKELDQEMNDIVKNNYGSLKIAFPVPCRFSIPYIPTYGWKFWSHIPIYWKICC